MRDDILITDIHAHVLPDVDDGPADIEEACDLLSMFYTSGVDRVICTSHYNSPHFHVSEKQLVDAFRTLTDVTKRTDVFPTLHLGAEVRISHQLRDVIMQKSIPTLGTTSYVLVEFPGHEISRENIETVYELVIRGLRPIMAHPERNLAIQKDNRILDELLDAGLLFQLTADCFTRGRARSHAADRLAWSILKNGQAALIASDAHNTTTRPPHLVSAYKAIESEFGDQVVEMLMNNANAIWDDMPCSEVVIGGSGKRKYGLFA